MPTAIVNVGFSTYPCAGPGLEQGEAEHEREDAGDEAGEESPDEDRRGPAPRDRADGGGCPAGRRACWLLR